MHTPFRRAIALSGLTAVVVVSGSIAVADGPSVQDITDRALSSAPEETDLTTDADTSDDNPGAVRGLDAETLDHLRATGDVQSAPAPAPRPRSTPDRGDRTAQDPETSAASSAASTESTGSGWIGHASWYGPGFHGNTTASGETYDQYAMTAAHKTLPFGTELRVTNTANGSSVVVRINDRGPFVAGRDIDVSRAAAEQLGFAGVATVRIQQL